MPPTRPSKTERDRFVLRLLSNGWSQREVARRTNLSPTTVKTIAVRHQKQLPETRKTANGRVMKVANIGSAVRPVRMAPSVVQDDVFHEGDCLNVLLAHVPDESVDLIITSPPYGKQRANGIDPNKYVRWFLARAAQFRRVLKPTGSFVLNLKEHVTGGVRDPYVLRLVLALIEQGWLWKHEYIWVKSNTYPNGYGPRLRSRWEPLFHFSKTNSPRVYKNAVKVPAKKTASPAQSDLQTRMPASGSGLKMRTGIERPAMVDPGDVIECAPARVKGGEHSAPFPEGIPEFFIHLFTQPGDLVLDPFAGSGTTALVADRLGRRYVGIDIDPKSVELARQRLTRTPAV